MKACHDDPQLRARLAADYVSGALRGGARRRFEGLMAADFALRREVQAWENEIYPLIYSAPPHAPPKRVWQTIKQQVRQERPARSKNWGWGGTYLWRLCSATLAAALIAVVVLPMEFGRTPPPQEVAVLQSRAGQTVVVIRMDASGAMYVNALENLTQMADGHALQLWSLPTEGAPKSLGMLSPTGMTKLTLPHGAGSMTRLAVSLEPPGGSPTGLPTGAVVMTGKILQS